MIGEVPTTIRRVRAVTVEDLEPSIDETPSGWFPARLQQPDRKATEGGAPRENPAWTLFYQAHGPDGPRPLLAPADRVTDTEGVEWEALGPATVADNIVSVDVHRVTDLYPVTGEIETTSPPLAVPVAIWSSSDERTERTGRYRDLDGEAPVEFYSYLNEINQHIDVNGTTYHVHSAVLATDVPRVVLRLRTTA